MTSTESTKGFILVTALWKNYGLLFIHDESEQTSVHTQYGNVAERWKNIKIRGIK